MIEPTLSSLQKTRYYRDLKAMEKQNIQQGLQQGERKKQEAIAQNMLAEGLDIALIAKVTGLSQRAIKALQNA